MPELPEVETIKNDLKKAILGKKIAGVEVRDKKAVENGLTDFLKALKGNFFVNISRAGKLLIFKLKDDRYLLIHLKLTGQLVYVPRQSRQSPNLALRPHPIPLLPRIPAVFAGRGKLQERGLNPPTPPLHKGGISKSPYAPFIKVGEKVIAGGHPFPEATSHPTKFTRAVFKFADSAMLYFNDMRRFGYLKIADGDELKRIKEEYGVDPLSKDFNYENFKKIFENKKMSIKAVLMDQKLIAGIGNIYSDEILFAARVKPTRPANSLKESELKKIFSAIRPILKKAIRHRGTSFSDYVDSRGEKGNFTAFLKIYGKKAGEKCLVCGGPVRAVKIGGRTAKFCPRCQR